MKILLIAFFLLPFIASSQTDSNRVRKGFGYWGAAVYGAEDSKAIGSMVIGGGSVVSKNIAMGAGVDLMIFTKGSKYAIVFGDLKLFIDGSQQAAPFISFQPGWNLYSQTVKVGNLQIKTEGAFSYNILAGLLSRPKKGVGFFVQAGYSSIGFTTRDVTESVGGLKFGAGIVF